MRLEMAKPGFLLAGLLAASVCLVLPTRSADAGTIMVRVNAANDDAEEELNDNSIDGFARSYFAQLSDAAIGDIKQRMLLDLQQQGKLDASAAAADVILPGGG